MEIPNINSLEFLSYDPYTIFDNCAISDFFENYSHNTDTKKISLTQIVAEEILKQAGGILFVWSDIYQEFREKKNHNLMKKLIRDQIVILSENPYGIRKEVGRCYICSTLIAFQNMYDIEKYGGFLRDCKTIVRSFYFGSLWKASCESIDKEDRKFISYITQSVLALIANYIIIHDNRNIHLTRPVISEFEEWIHNTSNEASFIQFINVNRPRTLHEFDCSNLSTLLYEKYDETMKALHGTDEICNQIIERVKSSKTMFK